MDRNTRTNLDNVFSDDKHIQHNVFQALMGATDVPVDWAYEAWDELGEALSHKNNRVRALAAQLLCNLAKSDFQNRMVDDFDTLLKVTHDPRFVTARHTLQSIWKVGAVGEVQQEMLMNAFSSRFIECITEKHCTMIRYDIQQGLRTLYDQVLDDGIRDHALALIEIEDDLKYRKKYAKLWK